MSRNLEPGATVIPRPERDLTERGDTRRIMCDVCSYYSSIKKQDLGGKKKLILASNKALKFGESCSKSRWKHYKKSLIRKREQTASKTWT